MDDRTQSLDPKTSMFWRYSQSPSLDLALNMVALIWLQIWVPCPVTSLLLAQNPVFLSLWELSALMSASVHLLWEMTPPDPLRLGSDGVLMQWFFLRVGYLFLTWRLRESGILTGVSVQEIPMLHVSARLSSSLLVGLDDLKSLFQPKQFSDSMLFPFCSPSCLFSMLPVQLLPTS